MNKECLIMNHDNFDRLNFLSEKVITETATKNELKEFNVLLNEWNQSVEFNLLHDKSRPPLE